MFCPKCGTKLPKDVKYCIECGTTLNEKIPAASSDVTSNDENQTPSIVWGIIGFFVPIAGLILFIIWKQDKPKDAKYAGIGALIYVGFYIILMILMFVIAMLTSIATY